jgi:hypothetical protein
MSDAHTEAFGRDGYTVVRGLFSAGEVEGYRDHYARLLHAEVNPDRPIVRESDDPLTLYPRIMHPHRYDAVSRAWMLHPRLDHWLTTLVGASPFAVQTMFYFKPPGARGQALHQDQFYLRVQPGTCLAAWMAIDPCDMENGCLEVVPGTHQLPVLCSVEADAASSFSGDTVALPPGMAAVPVMMEPGDVLFFNGQVVHGSQPNTSRDRFRRSLIAHYAVAEAEQISRWYHPVLRMDGTDATLGVSPFGGPCGVWVDSNGEPVVRMDGVESRQNYPLHG